MVADVTDFADDYLCCEFAYFIHFEEKVVEMESGGWMGLRRVMRFNFENLQVDCFETASELEQA